MSARVHGVVFLLPNLFFKKFPERIEFPAMKCLLIELVFNNFPRKGIPSTLAVGFPWKTHGKQIDTVVYFLASVFSPALSNILLGPTKVIYPKYFKH